MTTAAGALVGRGIADGVFAADLLALSTRLRGTIVAPQNAGYDEARHVWNGAIDRRPALVVRCAGVSDVRAGVEFGREHGLALAVRGGGHNVAGNAVGDGGLVLDLSGMRSVRVDPRARTARAEPGVTLGEFDRETQAFGLATTGGIVSTTGLAGLTLGGGVGWLVRKHGLSCDNLLSADVVTADGLLHTVSADDEPELLWGLRGGGGNFGVVTSLEYRLHTVGPVVGGMVVHAAADAASVFAFYRDFMATASEDLTLYCGMMTTPDGTPVIALFGCYSGPLDQAEHVLRPVRQFGSPLVDQMQQMPYCALQSMLDAAFPAGLRYYWKSGFLQALPDPAVDALVAASTSKPSPLSAVVLEYYGGAASRVPADATAFPHRTAQFNVLISAEWSDSTEDETHIRWARDAWQSLQPHTTGGVYVNTLSRGEGEERVAAAFGRNYERLAALKARHDPDNLFRFNHNVQPAPVPAPRASTASRG